VSIFEQLSEKPWTTPSQADDQQGDDVEVLPAAKVGLWAFLAVVTSVFGLFFSAYHMRAEYADWQPLNDPGLLWLNTAVLILSSVAFQWARTAAENGKLDTVRISLTTGGVLTLAFLTGQFWVWQDLNAAGFFAASNPANAFFYLLTGLHGLHLAGGLFVWAKTTTKVWIGFGEDNVVEVGKVRLSVELCTVYWHYLLLVWLVLLGLLLST